MPIYQAPPRSTCEAGAYAWCPSQPAPHARGALWFCVMDGADREADHLGVPVYTGRKSNQPPLMIPRMPCVAKFTTSYTESPLSMERGKKSTKWKTFVFVYHLLFSVIVVYLALLHF